MMTSPEIRMAIVGESSGCRRSFGRTDKLRSSLQVDAQMDTRRTTERAAKTKMIFNLTFYPLAGLAIRHDIDFVLTSGHFIYFIYCDVFIIFYFLGHMTLFL